MLEVHAVRRMIIQTKSLPTIPTTLYKIIECVEDEKSSASDLKKIILHDQSISAKVLNIANSAWFGFARRVEDISRAIVVLGFNTVLEIAMYVSFSTFVTEASKSSVFDPELFWLHSIAASEGAKYIARDIKQVPKEVCILIGLLHDIGKVMINYLYPDDYSTVLKQAAHEGENLEKVEKDKFGFSHDDVGEWLEEKWKFPLRFISSVKYHHKPEQAPPEFKLEAVLAYTANCLAKNVRIGNSGNPDIKLQTSRRSKILPYTSSDVNDWRKYLSGQTKKIQAFVYNM